MGLEDLGNIGEFVGAIAVVVSMIYLAVQVRRNTQSVDASIDNTYIDLYLHWIDSFTSKESATLILSGFNDPMSLSEVEAARFGAYICRFVVALEIMQSMHSRGALSEERWDVAKGDTLAFLGTRGGRLWWKGNRNGFTVSVVGMIDNVLENHDVELFKLSDWQHE